MKWTDVRNLDGFKNVLSLGFSNVVGTAISGLFWLYLAVLLGEENYGELGYYIAIASVSYSISMWGSSNAITVYVAKGLKIEAPVYFSTLISTSIAAIVLFYSFDNIGLSIFVLGAVIFNLTQAELLGRKLYKKFSMYFLLQKILFVIFAIILFYLMGPMGVLVGFGLSGIIFYKRIYNALTKEKINFGIIKEKFGFIANNYAQDLISKSYSSIDKLLIGPIFGFAILGNYYLGMQIFTLLAILPDIVLQYTLPKDSMEENTKHLKIFVILISVGIAFLGAFAAPIVLPWFFPEFGEAPIIISILSFAIIPYTISNMLISKFLGEEKSRIYLISFVISFVVLIIGILVLGEILGTIGLAMAFVISEIVKAGFLIIIKSVQIKSEDKHH